ncbi:hypothetical protein MIAR_00700 [Microbacterium arabinogalactanolyticum]|uniref:Uncharacterized protein n=1 Tax=Microbacterium arabinogalactanolyticum TaxID=69365 RepID=A0ABQ5NCN6_9MICO|nr:hypothetical protein MIAR_00700 [Microbacterium arabinogalactanolyticum]
MGRGAGVDRVGVGLVGSGVHAARSTATAPVPAPSSSVRRVMLIVRPDYPRQTTGCHATTRDGGRTLERCPAP